MRNQFARDDVWMVKRAAAYIHIMISGKGRPGGLVNIWPKRFGKDKRRIVYIYNMCIHIYLGQRTENVEFGAVRACAYT